MVTAQGERGDIELFHDFVGAELPVAGTAAYAAAAPSIGPFKITGDMADADAGTVSVAVPNGALRLTGTNENGEGMAVGTEVIFDPALNGTLTMETRVQRASVADGMVWAGFVNVNEDLVNEPLTSTGTALTAVATNYCGFLLDSQLGQAASWHCPFKGGTVTGPTASGDVITGTTNARNVHSVAVQVAVAAEYDLLRLDIFRNGTAEWRLNNILVQKQANAVSTSTDLACFVGVFSTTTTVSSLDVDYLLIKARRSWAR